MRNGVTTSVAKKISAMGAYERTRSLSFKYLPSDSFRYSVVVSKKQGAAVERNRVKRVVRACVRERSEAFPDMACLIYFRGMCGSLSRDAVMKDIERAAASITERLRNRDIGGLK